VINLVVVDDDRMLLDGLASWLAGDPGLRLTGTYGTVEDFLTAGTSADVVLLDLVLRDGTEAAANVRRLVEAGRSVLVISVWLNLPQVAATFAAGARGYLTKDHDLPELASAVRTVAAGGTVYTPELALACLNDTRPQRPRLSTREREVLLAYASGMTLNAAARHVGVRPETAKTYLDRVKAKYQALGRPTYTKDELAQRVREDGMSPEIGDMP
jgi:two-component system, NarL family, nitrate/nitrite response regulator NarL